MLSGKINLKRLDFDFAIQIKGDGSQHVSSEIVMSDIPWKIIIVERSDGNEKAFWAGLICSSPKRSELSGRMQWSCEATFSVSIRSIDKNRRKSVKNIPKTQFKNGCLVSEFVEIIRTTDLTQYVQNRWIVFDIQLFVNPLFIPEPSETNNFHTKFQFIVDNVSQLTEKQSPDMNMWGTTWNVLVQNYNSKLGVFLRNDRMIRNENWSWNAQCTFKLISFDGTVKPIVRKITEDFYFDVGDWGFREFVDWDWLLDPAHKFVLDDKAVFEIDLQVQPSKPLWNFESESSEENSLRCSICLRSIINRTPATTKCGHVFCFDCLRQSVQIHKKCPNCNVQAKLDDIRILFI